MTKVTAVTGDSGGVPPEILGCVWCWRQPARVQDTGFRMCQPCWTVYVAYVADEVEPPDSPFRQLISQLREIVKQTPQPKGEEAP